MFKLYGAGGAGINLASKFEAVRGDSNSILDGMDIAYIDTSESNVKRNSVPNDRLYLVEGANGSGKNRAENYASIKEQIKRILHNHKPEEFNCVLHSMSGGSGSVIGPLLVNELMDQEKNVIVISIGSSDSTIEIQNTIKTIKSYVGISQKRKEPIVSFYFENGSANKPNNSFTREQVDEKVASVITLLSAFFKKTNHELDYSDISNFLHYNKITDHDPDFVIAKFFKNTIDVPHNSHAVAALTLALPGQDTTPGYPVDYQAVGFLNEADKDNAILDILPNHLTIIDGLIVNIQDNLEHRLKEIANIKAANIVRKSKTDSTLDDGMVL